MNIFNSLDKFFSSLNNYLSYNYILIIFLALFVFTAIIIFITTSFSYEAKLIKAIDMFNNYFIKNPQITAENLLDFNNKMKSRKVPKQLRKQWQQFVLYRDKSASEYMSFELCVSSPIKNSTYKRDITIMNIVSYTLALVSFIMNLYHSSYEASSIVNVLQHSFLCPIIIIILNFFVTIILDIKHNAIVSDLNQNFQYFEVNIDKATTTIPEYVDYEVLFDKNEIKRGMPILYIYLQRRAEEEKRELERARLRNVEHEKFNFDEAGVAKSLVLERAMQEAENYIAERKKYLQDTEQINSEITQEEMNFREITKEYQREMQVSKETFDNFKSQLNDVSSSIEANYLKKQQQQELDRQRNLERDFDTASERHNALLKTLQEELDDVNNQIKQARTTLERGMMSEFDTYSQKVYADAERVVKERSSAFSEQQEQEIQNLKDQVNRLTQLNYELMNRTPKDSDTSGGMQHTTEVYSEDVKKTDESKDSVSQTTKTDSYYETENKSEPVNAYNLESEPSQPFSNYNFASEPSQPVSDYNLDNKQSEPVSEYNFAGEQSQPAYGDFAASSENTYSQPYEQPKADNENDKNENLQEPFAAKEPEQDWQNDFDGYGNSQTDYSSSSEPYTEPTKNEDSSTDNDYNYSTFTNDYNIFKTDTFENVDNSKEGGNLELPVKDSDTSPSELPVNSVSKQISIVQEDEDESVPKRKRGRPRKPKPEVEQPKRKVGRPKKPVDESLANKPKRPRGRPRKGCENKTQDVQPQTVQTGTQNRGESAKQVSVATVNSNDNIEDLDSYLKEIDNQIAEENAKMEASQKELEKNSRIRKRRR